VPPLQLIIEGVNDCEYTKVQDKKTSTKEQKSFFIQLVLEIIKTIRMRESSGELVSLS